MGEIKKLLNEILDETIAYYDSEDKLARDEPNGACHYVHTETGNQCAVGRYFTKEVVNKLKNINNDIDDPLFEAIDGNVYDFEVVMPLDSVLIDKVKGVPLKFWDELQQLHDSVLFKSLENYHLDRVVEKIKENIKLGKYEEN